MTLKLFAVTECRYMPNYIVLASMVFQLHDMRMVCLIKAVTNTIPFLLVMSYIRYSGSFDITSQGLMSFISRDRASSPACLKQTLLRAWWTD